MSFVAPSGMIYFKLLCAVLTAWTVTSDDSDTDNCGSIYDKGEVNDFDLESKLLFLGTNSADLFRYKFHYFN